MTTQSINLTAVEHYLRELQSSLCKSLENFESTERFISDSWERPEGGGGTSRVLAGGEVFESAGVNFSHIRGSSMPGSATARNPELAGRAYTAMGVSVVIHPRNPMVPTAHMNVRLFVAEKAGADPIWWFGGGYDLTPYYGFEEDARYWHETADNACKVLGEDAYPKYKQWCDDYFHNKHRSEQRGIGGLFFDDLNTPDFDTCFAFQRSVGNSFAQAYCPIVERRHALEYTEAQRQFQLYRRGRYVEFNLVYDRGTLFGLQSNGRVESILMSMPPLVRFEYNWQPTPGSEEEKLYNHYLKPRDWLRG